jgi:hypothetical protein
MPTPAPDGASPSSNDLALNQPGATLRQKSVEMRKSHPVLLPLPRPFGIHNDGRAWRRGAQGEEAVGRQLRKQGECRRVIHNVSFGKNDVDIGYVVIGSPGVFVLNTKNHLGGRVVAFTSAIYVNGERQTYLAKSLAEGRRATKLLRSACGMDVQVKPVIVIMASELSFIGSPVFVDVVAGKVIVKWLENQVPFLDPSKVESIHEVARSRSTRVS